MIELPLLVILLCGIFSLAAAIEQGWLWWLFAAIVLGAVIVVDEMMKMAGLSDGHAHRKGHDQ